MRTLLKINCYFLGIIAVLTNLVFNSCNKKDEKAISYTFWNITLESKHPIKVLNNSPANETYYEFLIKEDTFFIERSPWSNSRFEFSPPVFSLQSKKISGESEVFYSETPESDTRLGLFMTHFFLLDTTNGIRKIIKQPKVSGQGETALFVENAGDKNKLSIYSKNLNLLSQIETVEMFKSLKFKYTQKR